MEDVGVRLAHRLKKLRRQKRLTQEALAERSDISVKHVQRLESSKPCGVRLVTLDRLARALRVSLSELLRI